MKRFLVIMLRAVIVIVIMGGFFGQFVVIPTTAVDQVDVFPLYAPLAVPYSIVAILGVACVQVAFLAMWMLLTMVQRGSIFTPRALRWVDTITGCSIVGTLLTLGVSAHLFWAEFPPGTGMDVLSALGTTTVTAGGGAFFAMILAILRNLLRKATDLETEMAEVV